MIVSVYNDVNDKVVQLDTDTFKPPFNPEYAVDFDYLINNLFSDGITKSFGLSEKPKSPYYYSLDVENEGEVVYLMDEFTVQVS